MIKVEKIKGGDDSRPTIDHRGPEFGALGGCEAGMKLCGVSMKGSGVTAALDYFAAHPLAGAN